MIIGDSVWLPEKSRPIGLFEDKFTYTGEYEYIDDGEKGWRIKFLTSGTLELLEDVEVDIFAVGGGAGSWPMTQSATGGGGGYTSTVRKVTLIAGHNYTIQIGDGGIVSDSYTVPSLGEPSYLMDEQDTVCLANGATGSKGGSGGGGHSMPWFPVP